MRRRLAGAGGEGQEHAALALENRLHRAIDRDLLVVARRFSGEVVVGREEPILYFIGNVFGLFESRPDASLPYALFLVVLLRAQ